MAGTKSLSSVARNRIKKRTSIGNSVRSRPNHKGANKKRYRGQGR